MPHRHRLALVLVLALAGAVLTIAPLPTASAAPVFGQPVVVSGVDGSEPGINIGPDAAIYVNAPAGLLSNLPGSPSYVWRSDNGGATWRQTPFGNRADLPGGGDANVAIDPANGALYMTDLWLGSSTVSASTDRGETWTANPLQGVVVQDRQWVASSGNGIVYHVTHQIPTGLVVSKSVNGGVAYPVHSVAATPLDQTGCVCPPGNLIAEAGTGLLGTADKVGVVYATSTGGVHLAKSTNGGITWTNIEVSPASNADTTTNFPVVANAGAGHLVATWLEVENGRSRVMYNDSNDWGSTWRSPRALVTAGTSVYPWVDARGAKVAVSLYHTDTAGTPDSVNGTWFESYVESTDSGATFSSLVTADPTAVKQGAICTGGTNCSADRELGDFQTVVLDHAAAANLAYVRSVNNQSDTEVRWVKEG